MQVPKRLCVFAVCDHVGLFKLPGSECSISKAIHYPPHLQHRRYPFDSGKCLTITKSFLSHTFRYLDPTVARTLPNPFLRSIVPAHVVLRKGLMPGHPAAVVQKRKKRQRANSTLSKLSNKSGGALGDGNIPGDQDTAKEISAHTRMTTVKNGETVTRGDYLHLLSQEGIECSERRQRATEEDRRGPAAVSSSTIYLESSQTGQTSDGTGNKAITQGENPTTPPSATTSSVSLSLSAAGNISAQSFDSPTNSYASSSQPKSGGHKRAVDVSVTETNEQGNDDSCGFATWETVWDAKRESRGLLGKACTRFPGSSARQVLPSGLDETVERLCAASFLRGYVPEGLMPAGTAAEEAYQR